MRFAEAPATYAIAILTVIVSVVALLLGDFQWTVLAAGFFPARVSALAVGGLDATAIPVWLTPITAVLLHGDLLGLAFNMVVLVFCGRQVERAVGHWGIVILYLAGAYAAAFGHWMQAPQGGTPMIGALPAIAAIIAAYALFFGRARARAQAIGPLSADVVQALWLLVTWSAIAFLLGIAGGAQATIGALIGGFAVGLVLARPLLIWRYRHA